MAAPNTAGFPPAEGDEGRRQREVALRVFAAEYNEAKHSIKEDGTYSPTFIVSPFGAKVNRLLAVGVLTSVESVGQTGDRYRAQVVDPTGTFYVYAGQYEPEATQQLMDIRPPAIVAVVGKSRSYTTNEGATYVTVRPEAVRPVERADRDAWILEAAQHSMQRLDAMREAMKLATPTTKALVDLGFPEHVADGVVKAIEHYGKADLAKQAQVIRDALESLMPGASGRVNATPDFAPAAAQLAAAPRAPPAAPAPVAPRPAAPAAKPAPAAAENPNEPLILSLAEKLDDGKGAPWEDIVAEAAKKGVSESVVEECLNALMDKGQVYEPVLGRIKKT